MSQTRLFFTAGKQAAEQFFTLLELEFEEDGLPLASIEVDEAAGIQEISLYVDGDPADAERRMTSILTSHGHAEPVSREELPDVDWVARSLEGLKPVRAGRFFVHGSHDRHLRHIDDLAIEIEAGLAFGTGHHGTTAGCLEMIERVVSNEKPRNALDLGTGSAVLAIGIAKLAHIPVLATDIDPVATGVAEQNVRFNGVADLVNTATATGFDHPAFAANGPFDLIVANILAGPLMDLAPEMARHLSPDGSLILSGILDRQGDAVIAAYMDQRFRHVTTLHREGWVTIHLKH
ncbi:50S ribosomal protein L11 methyltransferase [Pseudaminobacter sp. 19-2017]|uniref:Ribosomal protein L11 methyltransferase n=1 Tax=Pseudaminobacter soli (ex Zhang et al. 2022) TaxID=2831468 RepID=A0A942E675_9HYPH|nr:50S ribosomal protein L11 methyltransferase [Pseudaminobacter soli]MBS3649197.1 50S ribosomal protein L11 methyltransferase [Pseudaminobacter soli]